MSGKRGGKGSRGGGGGKQTSGGRSAPQPQKTIVPQNPVQILIHHLLASAYQELPKEAIPNEETTLKCIFALEEAVRQILKEPKPVEYHKYSVKFCLVFQSVGKLSGGQSKVVVGVFFAFFIGEVTKNWEQYGISQNDVHKHFWKSGDVDPLLWKPEGITEEEYESWEKASNFLKVQK